MQCTQKNLRADIRTWTNTGKSKQSNRIQSIRSMVEIIHR